MMDIAPYTNEIAERMFVTTADNNYILARLAYFSNLDIDFYWLSLHAIEKYFKAILLINGQSAKRYSHDIRKLYRKVKTLHSKLQIGPIVKPHLGIELLWIDSTVEEFLARLTDYGNPGNRYMTYGYTVLPQDLLKVDQLVWSIRRYCRPFKTVIEDGGKTVAVIDEVEQRETLTHPYNWRLPGFLPIENMIDGRSGAEVKQSFLRLNIPFAPDEAHQLRGWRSASSVSPLSRHLETLQQSNAGPEGKELEHDSV